MKMRNTLRTSVSREQALNHSATQTLWPTQWVNLSSALRFLMAIPLWHSSAPSAGAGPSLVSVTRGHPPFLPPSTLADCQEARSSLTLHPNVLRHSPHLTSPWRHFIIRRHGKKKGESSTVRYFERVRSHSHNS